MDKTQQIPFENGFLNLILNEATNPTSVLIIAHGAGASMHHSFMKALADSFLEKGVTTVRFNFPYMDQGKKFPGNPKVNIAAWKVIAEWALTNFNLPVFISGKSYGGRMASHLAAENTDLTIRGLMYFGFPLHAPGKASTDRAKHLDSITHPQLFLQGANDALADIQLMRQLINKMPSAKLIEFDGADHSFKARGIKPTKTIDDLTTVASAWIQRIKK